MKRNEKILVYAVTGFLMVILGIAILFGNRDRATPGQRDDTVADRGSLTLQDLLRERTQGTARPLDELAEPPGDAAGDGQTPGTEGQTAGAAEPVTGPEGGTGQPGAAEAVGDPRPAPVTEVALNAQPPSPAEQVATLFGPSRRDRDFRIVTVRRGDTFRGLVQTWCGSVQEHLGVAERLNETAASRPLTPGEELVLPWVDDEVLLAAYEARKAGKPVAVESPEGENVRVYTVQKGDSIWAIAVREVGTRKAPAYIEEVRALNPQIADLDLLRVGQELRLPPPRARDAQQQ